MTPKEAYEARRKPIKEQRMAEENAYTTRMKRETAADECIMTLLDGVKAFFEGRASIFLSPMQPGTGQAIRFYKDPPKSTP